MKKGKGGQAYRGEKSREDRPRLDGKNNLKPYTSSWQGGGGSEFMEWGHRPRST